MAALYKKYFPEWTFRDFFNEVLVPIIFAIVIILMATVIRYALAVAKPWDDILTYGFIENILILGIPILFGIGWNRWAGGAAGFLLSWFWIVSSDIAFGPVQMREANYIPNVSWIGYIVASMMTGYLAGTLNHGSQQLKRCVASAMIAAWTMALVAFIPFLAYAKGAMYYTYGTPGAYGPLLGWGGEASNIFQIWMNSYFIVRGVWALEGAVFGRILMMMRPMYAGGATPHHGG